MRRYPFFVLLACVLSLGVGCGPPQSSGGRSGNNTDAGTSSYNSVCSRYEAACPGVSNTPEPLSTCDQDCRSELEGPTTDVSEPCWFMFCGLEVDLCEDEEDNDASILACGQARGWDNP